MRFRQYYSIKEIKKYSRSRPAFKSRRLIAVPPNVGDVIMPDYEALAAEGIHTDIHTGIRVFAGQRAEATYADLASVFNGLKFDRMPPFLTEAEDIDDTKNPFGRNRFNRTNVNTIALEIPIDHLTIDHQPGTSTAVPFLGLYASVHRILKHPYKSSNTQISSHKPRRLKQVSRMANPTFNILITDFETKNKYNWTNPKNDAQFQDLIKKPAFANYLSFVTGLPIPPEPRLGILSILYKYPGQSLDEQNCGHPCADLLHLNVQVPPTEAEFQSRLGALLSPDPAGLPNGRRPHDDVYDITLRAFGGPAFFAARIGDGINFSEGLPGAGTQDGNGYGEIKANKLDITNNGIVKEFPFLATPYSGN